jgi:hypothetical protein
MLSLPVGELSARQPDALPGKDGAPPSDALGAGFVAPITGRESTLIGSANATQTDYRVTFRD